MRLLSIVSLLLVLVCPVLCASPPVISNSFNSGLVINDVPWALSGVPEQVLGEYFENDQLQQTLYVVNQSTVVVFILQDFPNKLEYDYIPSLRYCKKSAQSGSYSGIFQWVQYSTYLRQQIISGLTVDTWNLTTASASLLLSVNSANSQQPVRIVSAEQQSTGSSTTLLEFYNFQAQTPPSSYFLVPSYCSSQANAKGVRAHDMRVEMAMEVAKNAAKQLDYVKSLTAKRIE